MYITSDTEKSESPHMTAIEHLNKIKQMHIDGYYFVCLAKWTNVAYISASENIVKISILIVSRQTHSSWNRSLNALDVLKLCYSSEWERLWTNHSNWFVNRFTGLIKSLNRIESKEWIIQTDSWTDSLVWSSLNRIESKEWIIQTDSWTDTLVWSSLWTELTQNNESFKLIREPIHWFDQVFEQNWLKIMNHSNWFVNRFTGLIKSLNRIDSK